MQVQQKFMFSKFTVLGYFIEYATSVCSSQFSSWLPIYGCLNRSMLASRRLSDNHHQSKREDSYLSMLQPLTLNRSTAQSCHSSEACLDVKRFGACEVAPKLRRVQSCRHDDEPKVGGAPLLDRFQEPEEDVGSHSALVGLVQDHHLQGHMTMEHRVLAEVGHSSHGHP